MSSTTAASHTWVAILRIRDEFIVANEGIAAAQMALRQWTKGGSLDLQPVYSIFRANGARQRWSRVVWDSVNLPRHSFIACLAIQGGLPTVDKINNRGLHMVNRCVLCEVAEETNPHLFFSCKMATEILQRLFVWTGITRRPLPLGREFKWFTKYNRGAHWRKKWRRCVLIATICEIWKERNLRIFEERKRNVDQIVNSIKFVVAIRVFALKQGVIEEELVDSIVN